MQNNRLLLVLLSLAALLAFTVPSGHAARTYSISSLSTSNCDVRDSLDDLIGDDRSGIAVTPTNVFHVGDDYTIILNTTLGGDDILINRIDGIVSDLADGALYMLGLNETTGIDYDADGYDSGITHLIPLSSVNNASIDSSRSVIALSMTLNSSYINDQPRIFAGIRGFAYASSASGPHESAGLFYVSYNTGEVTRIYPEGTDPAPEGWSWSVLNGSMETTENWASWGVLEEDQGSFTLVAAGFDVDDNGGIFRWSINGTLLSTILQTELSDCAAMTVSYFAAEPMWYAHGEYSVTTWADAQNEWLVACPATVVNNCGNGQVNAGEQCDDGNLNNGDGCSDSCDWEAGSDASALSCALCSLWA